MNARTPTETYEEAVERLHRTASRAAMAVLIVKASDADYLGGQGLQMIADRCGRPVITERDSAFHADTLFRPNAS